MNEGRGAFYCILCTAILQAYLTCCRRPQKSMPCSDLQPNTQDPHDPPHLEGKEENLRRTWISWCCSDLISPCLLWVRGQRPYTKRSHGTEDPWPFTEREQDFCLQKENGTFVRVDYKMGLRVVLVVATWDLRCLFQSSMVRCSSQNAACL